MHSIPPEAVSQWGVFTSAQAAATGWSAAALTRAVGSGRLERLARGAYRTVLNRDEGTAELDEPDRPPLGGQAIAGHTVGADAAVSAACAAALTIRGAALSHSTAARLHGLPHRNGAPACVTVRPHYTGDAEHVHLHRATLSRAEHTRFGSLPVTSVARTVTDVAREQGVGWGVAAADAALRDGRATRADLERACSSCRGWPGSRTAQAAADLADPRAESPLESLSRLAIADWGLPRPELQVVLSDGRSFLGRVDFFWARWGVVGEADGYAKYRTVDDLRAEKRRQDRLEAAGYRVVRWQWPDLRTFGAVAVRLHRQFWSQAA